MIRRSRRLLQALLAMAMVASTLAAMALPAQAAISFTTPKALVGFNPPMPPTSLQFGPDGRLYVGLFDGTIGIYNVTRTGVGTYAVSGSPQVLAQVSQIPNHDDDGSVNASVDGRLLTGIAVAGTASNPVIYATSSDPRIGGGLEGADLNLDTNSGTISRLTWSGSQWQHQVLVRGLPRSEENHGPNGLVVSGNTLYVAYGGNTNMGGPSFNFAFLPEYALSAAILKIDLAGLGTLPYDIPTLNDPDRTATQESATDPFGGNSGKNQAKIVSGGPVQVFAPGFRNPYDVMIATIGSRAGKMYSVDNGGNGGWGEPPANEGPGGNCTNANVGQSTTVPGQSDALHLVTQGYYGGHPNPTRGNVSNTFAGQSPIIAENPVECDFRGSKTAESTALSTMPNSTNGIAEYTANNFGGEMHGDLILASYQARKIIRVKLNATGTAVQTKEENFATFLQPHRPLDVTTVGPSGAFPGTIWIADVSTGEVLVMEPGDFDGSGDPCTSADDPNLDEDADGYDNADEIDNATNPCSAASQPPDNDGDGTSDLNDPNDDNDGQNDLVDPFQIDATNGKQRSLPVAISWENNDPPPGGIANSGFTGLMTNASTNYLQMFDENNMTIGGAAGVTTVGQVPAGDAFQSFNSQEYGFQLGVDVPTSGTFTASARVVAPFNGLEPWNHQSMGLFVGDGTQSNYVKIVTKGEGNSTSKSAVDVVALVSESADVVGVDRKSNADMPAGVDWVDLFLTVDVDAGTVQGAYEVHRNGVPEPRVTMGAPVDVSWPLETASRGLAAGIISTSRGGAPEFPATWDFFHVESGGGGPTCTGANDPGLDEDGDGFDNATEIAAGSDPCDAGSVPSSADDDGDGLPDTTDPFALDPQNGLGNSVPFQITGNANQGGILQTGFTGLMVNGDDYSTLYNAADVTVNGNITVANIPNGDAAGTANQLHNGFQVGVVPPNQTFDVTTEIVAPFSGFEPTNHQAMGVFISDGTQNNFVKLVTKGATTDPDKINMLSEVGNAKQVNRNKNADFPGADRVILTLRVNPGAGTVQGKYEVFRNGVSEGVKNVGAAIPLQWSLSTATRGLAVGIMSTSTGPGGPFTATWNYLSVTAVP